MHKHVIDLRSDTLSQPTEEMWAAMREASLDDDIWTKNPSMDKLETFACDMFNKEGALFVTSGTMGNLIAILVHTRPGDSVLLDSTSHTNGFEPGVAAFTGVHYRQITGENGITKHKIQ